MNAKSIEFVAPLAVTFTIEGKDLTITPLRVGELPAVVRAVEPMLDELLAMQAEPTPLDMVKLLGRHGEPMVLTIALCSRQPLEWVGQLLADRFAELAAVCVQVNADFFGRAMPAIGSLASRLQSAAPAAASSTGPTPSIS